MRPISRTVQACAVAAGLALLASASAWAEPAAPDVGAEAPADAPTPKIANRPPYEIVRSLHALQDQMALGSAAAQAALPALAARIADALLTADPDAWRDPRNARAAVSYVLSGGQPRVVRKILDGDKLALGERKLLEGALSYVDGREAKARQLLLDVDARTFPGALGGHLALAQAVLVTRESPARALRFLDTARLLAPGTLVEEAALRRGIVLADETNNFERFVYLSGQYLRRFGTSVYAQSFRHRFGQAIIRLGVAGTVAQFEELERLLGTLKPEERDRLHVTMAQAALVSGKLATARMIIDRTIGSLQARSGEAEQAALYDGAATLLVGNYEAGKRKIDAVQESLLPPRDRELLHAVRDLTERIHGWPNDADPSAAKLSAANPSAPNLSAAKATGDTADRSTAASLIASAEQTLASTDYLLKTPVP